MSTDMNIVHDLASRDYKWGFVTDIEEDRVPKGLNEDMIRLISARKNEPEFMLEWRLNALSPLGQAWSRRRREPKWANVHYRADRLSGHHLLLGAEAEAAAREPGRARSGDSAHLREAGHSAGRAEAAGRRRRGCGVRQRLGRDHLQGQAGGDGRDLLLVFRGGAEASRPGEEISGHGGSAYRQLLCGAECGGVHRWLVCLCAQGRALPDGAFDLFPHQRGGDGAVRAHADRCR